MVFSVDSEATAAAEEKVAAADAASVPAADEKVEAPAAASDDVVVPAAETSDAADPDASSEDVPAEVEALDGINSEDEAHNVERPARQSLKKKTKEGTPLTELKVGDTVKAKVKSLTSYGAFMDIGAETDGLLHISQLSVDFVSDVNEVLKMDQEYDVRIMGVDPAKKQVSLTLLTQAEEDEAQQRAPSRGGEQRGGGGGGGGRRDDSAVLQALTQKGWDTDQFVEGTVVSTVDFGAFVRVDCSQLNPEVEGSVDGLVHISSLAAGRVESVTDVVSPDDKVQVRLKGIEGSRKVSLSMISSEDEQAPRGGGGGPGVVEGNKNWKEAVESMQKEMPVFTNKPKVVDKRA